MINHKKTYRFSIAFILVTLVALFLALPSASAAATVVWVNDVKLDSSAYYLASGSTVATTTKPATGGYAYFNVAAGTLTLYNMQLNTPHTYNTYNIPLFANGDLNIVLTGASTLQYHNNDARKFMGIYVQGSLTISGSGSLSINISNTNAASILYGIYVHDLAIASGTISMDLESVNMIFGFDSFGDILVTGGSATIRCDGEDGYAIAAQMGDFRMTDGTVDALFTANDAARGLYAFNILLEGGSGTFAADGIATGSMGGEFKETALSVTGGHFIFRGRTYALNYQSRSYTLNLENVLTYVSTASSGSGRTLWASAADGVLINTTAETSPFLFVEFMMPVPQTGDSARPWLWAGIGAGAVLLAATAVLLVRRRRS